ncbi:tRNA pseudouridine(38-40) synthase TruA [Ancylomarina longa]|uniref:tRNA pseudouridine(38-40) synthase TruA n=1 Tax=Ancylomarina longa TaxID=2487017 RepID=UPI001ADEAB29|nr:tRNA pseudouridine(38-40) synthase TruA [Ancylomarina longa]
MRYFFHIGYKGTNYQGWQRQLNAHSVQECIEKILSQFLKEDVHCIGCGRTDSGVHASQYYFHINTKKIIESKLFFPINRMLPRDIAVYEILEMQENNHAQYHATARTYNYFIHTKKNPFLNEISALYSVFLDGTKMQEAANLLIGKKDFRAYCKTPDRHNHTFCEVSKAQFYSNSKKDMFRFEITANRFLKGMIRILMQQFIEIGSRNLSLATFQHQLEEKSSPKTMKLAYPQGLYLSNIIYPFLKLKPNSDYCPLLQLEEWKAFHQDNDIHSAF